MHDSRTWRQRTGVKTLSHPPTLLACIILFAHNLFLNYTIALKFCTEHSNITAVLCTNFQKRLDDWNG